MRFFRFAVFIMTFLCFSAISSLEVQQPPQLPQILVRTINFAQDVNRTIPEVTFKKLSNISGTIKDALQDITLQPDDSYPLTNIDFDNFSPLLPIENGKSIIDLIYDSTQGINIQNNRQEIKKRIAALSENQIVQLIQLAIYLDIIELSNQSMRAYVAKFAKQRASTFESEDAFNAYIKTIQQTFTPAAQKELGQALIMESPELIPTLLRKLIKKQEPPNFVLNADSKVMEMKFAPDSAKLVSVGKSIEIWGVPNKELIKTIAREPGITVTALTWDPNKPILWIALSDGTLMQYDTNTYEKIKEEKLDVEINTIAFGPGATMPMLGLSDESMTEIKQGDKPKPPYPFVGATSIHITSSYIFFIDFHIQDAFYMVDRKTGKLDRIPFSENFTYVLKLAAGPADNTLLLIGRREIPEEDETAEVDSLGLWDIQKKSFIWSRDFEAGAIDKFVFNKQLNMIATTISDDPDEEPENVQIWDGSSGEKITEFEIDDLISTIDWNVEGTYLAAGAPGIIYIWQMIPFKDDLKRLSLIHVQLLLYILANNIATRDTLPAHLHPLFEELPESIKTLFAEEPEEGSEPEKEGEGPALLEEVTPTLGKRKRED